MKILAISVFATAIAAGSAFAAPVKLTDVDYLRASRCAGLSKTLTSGADEDKFSALLKAQRGARELYIIDRAEREMEEASRAAKKESRRDTLIKELAGPCQAFLGPPAAVAKQ